MSDANVTPPPPLGGSDTCPNTSYCLEMCSGVCAPSLGERAQAAIATMSDTMTPVYKVLHTAIVREIGKAVAAEREACARLCDEWDGPFYAETIRARGAK